MKLYRFRSMEYLLGDEYQELEKQTIYFASPDELNDPMEGFRDIVWRGDKIVWTNLFKHYVFCMHESYFLLRKTRDSRKLSVGDIPILGRWDEIPIPEKQRLFDDIWYRFHNLPYIREIIEAIANRNREIRYRELGYYCRSLQSVLLVEIQDSYILHGFMHESERNQLPEGSPDVHTMCALIRASIAQFDQATAEELNLELLKVEAQDNDERIKQQLNSPISSEILRANNQLMHFDFPNIYLQQIERVLWHKWYIACFTEDYRNSSVWAHYGDKHEGACLIFESGNIGTLVALQLYEMADEGKRPTMPKTKVPFFRVDYANKPAEVDFFRYIGELDEDDSMKPWYTDDEGNTSEYGAYLQNDNDMYNWQNSYWNNFYRDITTKTKDWKYEQECRLILESRLGEYDEKKNRTLAYDFTSLKGIIFGIKTSDEHRLSIIKIIQRKCKDHDRTDFKFYQAYHSSETSNIHKREIQLS